jgi:hypothetical protein
MLSFVHAKSQTEVAAVQGTPMDSVLCVSRHAGLPKALARLEWYMEVKPDQGQLSRPGFDYFDFGGW